MMIRIALYALLLTALISPAQAQEPQASVPAEPVIEQPAASMPDMAEEPAPELAVPAEPPLLSATAVKMREDVRTGDATVIMDKYKDDYVRGTPDNLARLYWRLGVFDSGDSRAVDNFMLITECRMYQNNINNDFEWAQIRIAAKDSLKIRKEKFPTKFEFLLPVELGNYDANRGGFPLTPATAYNNIRRLEITGNSTQRDLCGKKEEIKDYPRNVMMILENPFTYNFAKVNEHVAQAYILRKQEEIINLPVEIRQSRYQRLAFLRLRVDFSEYQGNIRGQNGDILAILYGKLDGIDLFEDDQEALLLSPSEVNNITPQSVPASDY